MNPPQLMKKRAFKFLFFTFVSGEEAVGGFFKNRSEKEKIKSINRFRKNFTFIDILAILNDILYCN